MSKIEVHNSNGLKDSENLELYKLLADASFEAIILSEDGKCIGQNLGVREKPFI